MGAGQKSGCSHGPSNPPEGGGIQGWLGEVACQRGPGPWALGTGSLATQGKGLLRLGGGAFGPNSPRGKQAGSGQGSRQGQVTTGVGSARKTNQLGTGLDS